MVWAKARGAGAKENRRFFSGGLDRPERVHDRKPVKDLSVRQVFGDKPPIRVEYSITEFGATLIPALEAIAGWGRNLGETEGEIIEND